MTKFVAIDIETGGLDPLVHPITEVALVYEGLGKIEEVEFSLPFSPSGCDPRALEIQGYGKRERPEVWMLPKAARFLQGMTRDAYIIGKNPWFDTSFIELFLRDWGYQKQWHHRLIDVGALAWGFTNGLRSKELANHLVKEPPNSATVGNLMNHPLEEVDRHAALYDAKWAWDVFREIVPA